MFMLVLPASAASAEIYRWEDANGINFTDDSSTVPEKYRGRPFAEAGVQSESTDLHARDGINRQYNPDAARENRAAVHQANLDHHMQAAEARKQKQINTRNFQNTLQSLANLIVLWAILGFFLFLIWAATIADIVRSEFVTPSNKTFWLLLVLLLPLLGMVPYLILGPGQKCNSVSSTGGHRLKLPAQLHPAESKA
jgi:hypothetical protein